MQCINDNNIDELFQSAAKNYPLRADRGDWQKVAQKLEGSSTLETFRKFNKRYLSILTVLFVLTGVGFYTNFYFTNKKITELEQPKNNKTERDTSLGNSIFNGKRSRINSTVNGHALTYAKEITTERFKTTATRAPRINNQANEERKNQENRGDNNNALLNRNNIPVAADTYNIATEKNDILSGPRLWASETTSIISDLPTERTSVDKSSGKKSNAGKLYVGLVVGPQLNEVKGQGFKKVGGELGLLFGYALAQKISIESGLILSNKKYYSAGQYFNMEKISATMPPGMKIIAVQSNATVLEVPLKGRYDLIAKKNGNLFITAGASSYLLLHEQNNYHALVNGGQQDLEGDYGTMRKYFATSINLSAGYEKNVGKRTVIRVEPYLEFPLKGLGMGSMSVFGTGLHLGLTLPVRKN